jgi:hypothetical protein
LSVFAEKEGSVAVAKCEGRKRKGEDEETRKRDSTGCRIAQTPVILRHLRDLDTRGVLRVPLRDLAALDSLDDVGVGLAGFLLKVADETVSGARSC